MAILSNMFNLSPTSNYLPTLQVENCASNSRLVVDGDFNGNFYAGMKKLIEIIMRKPSSK